MYLPYKAKYYVSSRVIRPLILLLWKFLNLLTPITDHVYPLPFEQVVMRETWGCMVSLWIYIESSKACCALSDSNEALLSSSYSCYIIWFAFSPLLCLLVLLRKAGRSLLIYYLFSVGIIANINQTFLGDFLALYGVPFYIL